MKMLVVLVALLALVGSAMAWDISEDLQYSLTKTGFQQGGSDVVMNQIEGTSSGAYMYEPNINYGDVVGWVSNTLGDVTLDREQTASGGIPANPTYSAAGNNFYTSLTQAGTASMSISCQDTIAKTPEIVGEATASQNLWVGGEFAATTANFDSRAIIGFAPSLTTPTSNFAVTDTTNAVASVDADKWGAGYFNTANMGVEVEADIEQNYVGSGWAEPTYSGGITMWSNFAGACDPNCSNPIVTTVDGEAFTSLFPADGDGGVNSGATYYWDNWATNPTADATPGWDNV